MEIKSKKKSNKYKKIVCYDSKEILFENSISHDYKLLLPIVILGLADGYNAINTKIVFKKIVNEYDTAGKPDSHSIVDLYNALRNEVFVEPDEYKIYDAELAPRMLKCAQDEGNTSKISILGLVADKPELTF